MEDVVSRLRERPVHAMERMDDAIVVRLSGELDLRNVEEIRAALAEAIAQEPGRLVVDLSEVLFLDSTVLGVLIEARAKLGKRGLLLASPQLEPRRALEVSGIDRHLPVHDSVQAALTA